MAEPPGSRLPVEDVAGDIGRYQKLYAMLLDAIPSSVLLIDAQFRVVSANHNFLEKARRLESDTVGQRIDTPSSLP